MRVFLLIACGAFYVLSLWAMYESWMQDNWPAFWLSMCVFGVTTTLVGVTIQYVP